MFAKKEILIILLSTKWFIYVLKPSNTKFHFEILVVMFAIKQIKKIYFYKENLITYAT